jgi:hypothetical protein
VAIRDWFIGVPNSIGALFNVLCLLLCERGRRAGPVPRGAAVG